MNALRDSILFYPTPHLQIPAELYFQVERDATQVCHLAIYYQLYDLIHWKQLFYFIQQLSN